MKAEVIAIGDELLLGDVGNGNAQHISRRLSAVSIEVAFHTTVGDNIGVIAQAIRAAIGRVDAVVMTGGLGPTHDDLTREAISEATGRKLVFHPELEEDLRRWHDDAGREMTEINLKQAYLPEGAVPVDNPIGTAPGLALEHDRTWLFALPGVPEEMVAMLDDGVVARLGPLVTGEIRVSHTLRVAGIPEAELAERIASTIKMLESSGNTSMALLPSPSKGEIAIRIDARARNHHEGYINAFQVESRLRNILGSLIYGPADSTLPGAVADALRENNKTLATAESFTGGQLVSSLISVPDASEFLLAGYVTYSLEAKMRDLGVPADLLNEHGAVSAEVARAMAEGARKTAAADVGVSTTGEAGPDPAEEPVGTMYIGIAWDGGSEARKFFTMGERDHIRTWGTHAALNSLRLWLAGESTGGD
ncbi:MAG: competence/damage-inducible protein A [Actinomycetota bacterium]